MSVLLWDVAIYLQATFNTSQMSCNSQDNLPQLNKIEQRTMFFSWHAPIAHFDPQYLISICWTLLLLKRMFIIIIENILREKSLTEKLTIISEFGKKRQNKNRYTWIIICFYIFRSILFLLLLQFQRISIPLHRFWKGNTLHYCRALDKCLMGNDLFFTFSRSESIINHG